MLAIRVRILIKLLIGVVVTSGHEDILGASASGDQTKDSKNGIFGITATNAEIPLNKETMIKICFTWKTPVFII